LRESEKRYRDLFENASDLIQIVQPDGRFLYVNKAWRQTFGYTDEDSRNLSIFDIISSDCQDHCAEVFKKVTSEERVHAIETKFVTKDGRKIDIEGSALCKFQDGKPVSSQCIFRDVSDKKRMEEEMLKAQKLESVGVLAGGIAHDFNNLLTGIIGNISIAKINLKPGEELFERLDESERAALRAKKLTQQLLTFAKGGAPVKRVAVINGLVQDSTSFALRGANTACDYFLADDLWAVDVDEGQLGQVVQNLVLNAKQAMPDGGVVTVRTRNATVFERDVLPLMPGRYVQLSVEDHGLGIRKEDREKIFDPYFSSKEGGCGLGLAIAYSIVKKHNGLIKVDSEVGKGTAFTVYLPVTDRQPVVGEGQKAVAGKIDARVLVVDDEELVRSVASSLLKHLGCYTEAVRDGNEAIESYKRAKESGKPFDVVIMDLTIPGGMGGKEAVKRLLEIDPQVKAIVSSGYATDPVMANYRDYGFVGVIPKPFRVSELGDLVAQVMGEEVKKKISPG
jgi:PAS domain S-box-containing protein